MASVINWTLDLWLNDRPKLASALLSEQIIKKL
jgi:hypothetical protein